MSNVQDNAAHTCSYSCDRPQCIKAQRDELAAAAAQEASATQEVVGEAGAMPGTDGFTVACFRAEDVPVGTKLYAAPVTAAPGIDLEQFRDVVDYWLADAEKLSPGIGRNGTIAYGKRLLALIDASTPAAPGIDRDAVERLRNLADYAGTAGYPSMGGDIKALLGALDASPKGATLNEQFGSAEGLDSPKGGSEAKDAARYRHLQKVTPFRFKKLRDTAVTDAVDVLYFHADRFDAALDAHMQATSAEVGV